MKSLALIATLLALISGARAEEKKACSFYVDEQGNARQEDGDCISDEDSYSNQTNTYEDEEGTL